MGKLFGSKGDLRVELDRGSYQPGDVVNGTVYLSVSDEIKTKGALVLEVNGKEYVKYNEVYGEAAVPRKQKNQLLADQLVLNNDHQVFAPGEYVFPFNCQLRSTLPGSFHVDRRHAGEFCDIDAAVQYELKLRLPVKGTFSADIKTERPLVVKTAQTAQLVQPRTEATAQHAKLLGMIRQGNCQVSGSLERDVFVAGETLLIRASVVNGSSMDVKSVSVRLVENLVIHATNDHGEIKAQTCLAKKEFAGVKAGATKIDQAYSLDLVGRSERFAVLPPMTSSLVSTSHHVEVRCKFLMSPNMHIEIPVKILAPLVADVATASTQLMTDHKTKDLYGERSGLGVGIKGHLRLELERDKYQAGELVQGTIFLSVEEEIRCNGALILEISGVETIAWTKRQGENNSHHRDKNVILQHQLKISCDRDNYFPGEFVYPFSYQLQTTLPGSFQLSNRSAGRLKNIRAQMKYELEARQPVQGAFRADLEAKREFGAIPIPTVRIVHPLERSTSREILMVTMFRKGTCQLSAYMDRNVFTPGEKVMVRCSVFNLLNVRALSLRLFEDLVLHHMRGGTTRTSTCLCKGEFSGILAGESADRTVSLRLVEWQSGCAMRPSTASRFVSWSYRVEVRCTFLMSPSVVLDFPITIVHQNNTLHTVAVGAAAGEDQAQNLK